MYYEIVSLRVYKGGLLSILLISRQERSRLQYYTKSSSREAASQTFQNL